MILTFEELAEIVRLKHPHSEAISDTSADRIIRHITNTESTIMAAIDDLKAAVDAAVTEMQTAAATISAHPASANDTVLTDLANRLNAAASALHGTEPPPVA